MIAYEDLVLSISRLCAFHYLIKNHRFAWPLTLCITLYKIFILYQVNLKILALSKCINLAIGSMAWNRWYQQDQSGTNMPSSILNRSQLRFIWALCLTFIIIHHFHMTALGIENITAILSTLGYCLAAYRKRECWTAWVIYDCFILCIFIEKELYMSALTTCLYFPIGLIGNIQWKKQSRLAGNTKHMTNKQISSYP